MTHNIVAQFSCSLDEHGNFKEYRVVAGSVFNEEYNETLDSATIVLSQISKEDRLSNIKPYDFVRVFDKSSEYDVETGTYALDKVYLVDNFDEKENNIKEHIFGYTINLMSETKLLEKIQCPNLTITHEVENGVVKKKTIFEYIKRYMELYVPKIKFSSDGENWDYEPLIKIDGYEEDDSYHEASIVINYTDSNFEYFSGHGTYYYQFSCESDQLPNNIDYDSVIMLGVVANDDDVSWTTDFSGGFIPGDGVFRINAYSSNSYYGSLTVTYKYKRLIQSGYFYERFNSTCADMAFTAPTLRQLLTILMQQVGCIPVVRNRKLTFLDFQSPEQDFAIDGDYSLNNTVNYIRRSLSSDSFANSLVNMSEQVLDSGNEVICETLGFRDKSNLLLKQTENLYLETSLPIYKVNKCIMRFPGKYSGYLSSNVGCVHLNGSDKWPEIYYRDNKILNGTATVKFSVPDVDFEYSDYYGVRIDNNLIYFLGRKNDGSYYVVETQSFSNFQLNSTNTITEWCEWQYFGYDYYVKTKTFNFSNLNSNVVGFCFSGVFVDSRNETKTFSFIKFDDANDSNVDFFCFNGSPSSSGPKREPPYGEYQNVPVEESAFAVYYINFAGNRKWDISKLVVEDSVRQLLDRDFVKMVVNGIHNSPNENGEMTDPSTWTIENLSKYVYGTVGYSIGSKTISGFSDVFNIGSAALGWVQQEYTYIENIVNVLKDYYDDSEKEDLIYHFFGFLEYLPISYGEWYGTTTGSFCVAVSEFLFIGLTFKYYSPITEDFSGQPFFSTCIFDVYYQPLNSFNLSYTKTQEELDYPLEQYDGNASGLTDFDRLSIHEQEQVDRIGNETLSISQRTNDYNNIRSFENGPLVFKDDTNRSGDISDEDNGIKYIIFKRSFSVGNNCYNVSYTGSKDAVLKNYFTSIRTKYRAYQYVDYSQSVLRKERDTLFIRMATNYFDGDDKIFFGNKTNEERSDLSFLQYVIYDIEGLYNSSESDIPKKISYEIEEDNAKIPNGLSGYYIGEQIVKNSVSCFSTDNMFGITYEYVDNVGAGPFLNDITTNAHLGGIPQSWQIWADNYSLKHEVSFTNYIDFYSQMITNTGDANVITGQIKKIEKSPVVDPSYSFAPIFYVADSNKDYSNLKRTFYKDYAERINHTIQFIYYAPNKDVLVNENFISGAPVLQRYDNPFNFILGCDRDSNFNLNSIPHRTVAGENPISESSGDASFANGYIEVIKDRDINHPTKIRVYFHGYKIIKMAHYDSATQLTTDIAAFKCPKELQNSSNAMVEYFFAINDTKTDYILSEKNGILYRRYKAKTYTEEQSGNDGPYPRKVENIYDEEE